MVQPGIKKWEIKDMANWYPKNMVELAAWWANLLLRRAEFEAKYQILGTRKAEIIDAGLWIQYWVDARHTFDDMSTQLSKYFNTISGNDPSLDPPAPITWTLPPGTPAEVPPGIEKMIRDIRREVVGLTNYAKADGEALGFEATTPANVVPSEVKPTIQITAAAHGYAATITVSNRSGIEMWDAYLLRKGGSWTKFATCSGKLAEVTITPTTPGEAEQVQIYVQLRKSNSNFGQPSQPDYVTFNP